MLFKTIAVIARAKMKASGSVIALGHVHQLLAAGLGYSSLAALQASTEENPGIDGADRVILDVEGITGRAVSLSYGKMATVIIDAIVAAIENVLPSLVIFRDRQEFIDDVACSFASDNILDHDAVSSAAAETNAYFNDMHIEPADPEPLKDSREFWDVPVLGNVSMDQDPDKMFYGDKILISGCVRVRKAGRVCLMDHMELDIDASVDDSYYESDDELDKRAVADHRPSFHPLPA